MMLWDAAVLAATNLRKNPVRTLLTILGLGVGVGAILTVVTLGGAGGASPDQAHPTISCTRSAASRPEGSTTISSPGRTTPEATRPA